MMFFLFAFISNAQDDKQTVQPTEDRRDSASIVMMPVEVMPQFPGGEDALIKYLSKNLKYPANAKKSWIEGTVYVTFLLDKEGKVTEPKILKSVSEELDAEAIRLVNEMPQWTPGTQNGKPVIVQYNLPVRFKL